MRFWGRFACLASLSLGACQWINDASANMEYPSSSSYTSGLGSWLGNLSGLSSSSLPALSSWNGNTIPLSWGTLSSSSVDLGILSSSSMAQTYSSLAWSSSSVFWGTSSAEVSSSSLSGISSSSSKVAWAQLSEVDAWGTFKSPLGPSLAVLGMDNDSRLDGMSYLADADGRRYGACPALLSQCIENWLIEGLVSTTGVSAYLRITDWIPTLTSSNTRWAFTGFWYIPRAGTFGTNWVQNATPIGLITNSTLHLRLSYPQDQILTIVLATDLPDAKGLSTMARYAYKGKGRVEDVVIPMSSFQRALGNYGSAYLASVKGIGFLRVVEGSSTQNFPMAAPSALQLQLEKIGLTL